MPNPTRGRSKGHWSSKHVLARQKAEQERRAMKPENISAQYTLASGVRFTRLRLGIAVGAETVDFWKGFRL